MPRNKDARMGRSRNRTSRTGNIYLTLQNLSAYTVLQLLRILGAGYSKYVLFKNKKVALCDILVKGNMKAVDVKVEYFKAGVQVKGSLVNLLIDTLGEKGTQWEYPQ